MNPGIYPDMSEADYRKADGISQSDLKLFAEAPAKLEHKRRHPEEDEDTPAKAFGRILHTALLRPKQYEETKWVYDRINWTTVAGRAQKEQVNAVKAAGKMPVTMTEAAAVTTMKRRLAEHKGASAALAKGKPEVPTFAFDPTTPILKKGMIDWIPATGDALIDVKTARSAEPRDFGKSVWDMDYLMQAAYYLDIYNAATGEKRDRWAWIVAETAPPYLVAMYYPTEEQIEYGRQKYKSLLPFYKSCVESGEWPGYCPRAIAVTLPGYSKFDIEAAAKSAAQQKMAA